MNQLLSDFHKNLISLRKEKGFKKAAGFARVLGVPIEKYRHYEKRSFPPLEVLIQIVKKLEITFDDLFQPFLSSESEGIQEIIRRIRRISKDSQMKADIIMALKFLEFEHQLRGEAPGEERRVSEEEQ